MAREVATVAGLADLLDVVPASRLRVLRAGGGAEPVTVVVAPESAGVEPLGDTGLNSNVSAVAQFTGLTDVISAGDRGDRHAPNLRIGHLPGLLVVTTGNRAA